MKNVKYISASAGSGKTYTLTETLTEAIKCGDVEPENVILTTFTKAAASEFKEKAKAMLYENGMVAEADRLDQALIGTIHSVAESFIQKYWYILGLSPKITPIAEEDLEFFKNQSLVNLLTDEELSFLNHFAEEFELKPLQSKKIDYNFWKSDLSKILEYTKSYKIENYNSSIACSKELTKSLVHGGHHIKVNLDALGNILKKAEKLNDADDSENQDTLRIKINAHKRNLTRKDPASIKYAQSVIEFLNSLPWKELKEDIAAFKESLDNLYASEEVREILNRYAELLFSLASKWNKQYEDYKKENHLIDFSDMEVYFYQLLHNKEVASDISSTYKYVFVDEFQDCSPMQVMIFDELSKIVENNIWVGDKKQAIYGFRGSDTELTTAVMDIIKEKEKNGQDGCSTDILSNSWRSLSALVNFTNEVFASGFGGDRKEVCLTPQRDDGKGSVGYWLLTEGRKEDRASTLAANIVELINNGEDSSSIAVLARSNSDLNDVAAALREYNVPVYIDESGQAGADTVSLVSSLLQLVADETAELPKAQIAFLTEKKYKLEKILDDKIEYNQDEDCEDLFYENIPLVKKLLADRDRYILQSVAALVESLIIELDLYNIAKKLNDDVDTTKLLHAIIDSAAAYEDHCTLMHIPSSILGFVAYLEENDISVSGSTEGVQLFTYHKSKGLEWKTCIILGCDNDILEEKKLIKRNIFGTQLIRVTESTTKKLFPEVKISVLPNIFGNRRIPDEWLNPIQESERYEYVKEREKEETKRLMYVALTRPRDNLILALNGKGKNPKPLVAFQEMDFEVSKDFSHKATDLFGVGVFADKLDNAESDIEYDYEEEKNEALCISGKADKKVLPRDLQPSSMPSGKVKAEIYEEVVSVHIDGKYNSAALGTCIHDIFCVADDKTDKDISDMIDTCGLEKNIKKSSEIKQSWDSLTKFLKETYGDAKKQYHELPFKQRLETEQVITGSMDFVWETSKGCVVVDYKTFPGKKEDLLDAKSDYYIGKYKGQLECYENALKASGKKVIAKLLFYPVVGVIVKIS